MESTIRILMLGDSENDAILYSKILQQSGLNSQVARVQSLNNFWLALKEFHPDIIFIGLSIHDVSFSDVIGIIKEVKRVFPVIVLDWRGSQAQEQLFWDAGASAFLNEKELNSLGVIVKALIEKSSSKSSGELRTKNFENEFKYKEEQLRFLIQFEKLISTLAASLIDVNSGKIDMVISNSLRLLAKYLSADRAFIALFDSDNQDFNYAFQWFSTSIQQDNKQNRWIKADDLPWFYSQICDFSMILTSPLFPLPQSAYNENRWLKSSGIISLVYIPLVSQGNAIGFLGFDCFKVTKHQLTEEFKKIFRIAAAMFVNVLNRKGIEQALVRSESNYRTIFENTGTAMVIVQNSHLISIANTEFVYLSGYTKSEIEGRMRLEELIYPDDAVIIKNFQITDNKDKPTSSKYELRITSRNKEVKYVILHAANIPGQARTILSFIDITDRVHAEQRLREMDTSKSEFVSMASHELRTPLTGIIGLTQTLLAEDIELTEDERRRFLQIIESEGNRLSILLSELLDLTKIETGTTEFNPVDMDISELINETISVLPIPLTIRLNLEIPSDHPIIGMADRDRIKQVLMNLLENAIRYSEETGTITITVKEQNHTVAIAVSDTGSGIKKEDIPKIFEKFYRSKAARKIASKGTGLGLTIAKNIIEAHGGKIWVHSIEGQGTTFTFTIPKGGSGSESLNL